MRTLLQSALTGWTEYTQHGKFAVFLLLAILYLGFELYGNGMKISRDEKNSKCLYLYGVLMTLGCICPVTALVLLKYQTGFYSYVWIWAAVPQTALIAWAATEFLYHLSKEKSLRNGMAVIILLGILFLGGNPVSEWTGTQTAQIPSLDTGIMSQREQKTSAWETLEQLSAYHDTERGTEESAGFTLWAPKDIMAAARAYSAQIRPVYGRSIWEASMGRYSYDTNETWQEDLYLWMDHLETTGETDGKIDFAACLDRARKVGIDYILLPEGLSEDAQQELQRILGKELQPFGEYFLIVLS